MTGPGTAAPPARPAADPCGGADEAWYAYCLLRRADADRLAARGAVPVPGIDDRAVRFVGTGGVVAAAASVPLAGFRTAESESDLTEHGWLCQAVRRHEQVVEHLFGLVTVLPFRFGALYPGTGGLADALRRHESDLLTELFRLDGAAEWGVRAFVDATPIARVPGPADRGRPAADAPGAGTQWMLRRQESARARREARDLAGRMAADAHARLARHARDAVLRRRPGRSRHGEAPVLDAAYLVPRDGEARLRAEARALSERHAASRLEFELTGPWPPYHFARITGSTDRG